MAENDNWWTAAGAQPEGEPEQGDPTQVTGPAPEPSSPAAPSAPESAVTAAPVAAGFPQTAPAAPDLPQAAPAADPTFQYITGPQGQSPYAATQYGPAGYTADSVGQYPGPQAGQPGFPGTGNYPQYGPATGAQPYAQAGQPGYPATGNHPQYGPPTGTQPGAPGLPVTGGYPQYGAQPYPGQPGYPGTGNHPQYGAQPYVPGAQPGYPGTGSYPPVQPGVAYGYPQGGNPGYPGPPFPESLVTRPPRRTGAIVAIVAAVVVLLLVIGGLAVAVTRHRSADKATGSPGSTTATSSSAPALPGYRPVAVPGTGITYQIPLDWTSAAEDSVTLDGIGASVTGTGKSYAGAQYCPGSSYRSEALLIPSTATDPAAAATATAAIAAQAPAGYQDPTGGRPTAPTAFTSTAGITGQRAQTDGSWTPGAPGCSTTTYTVYTFAFPAPSGNGILVLTILSDRGTADELSADQATKILATVRKS